MSYSLDQLKYVILETCYHCHGTGLEPDQGGPGDPPVGSKTCTVCNKEYDSSGVYKRVTAEIWEIN